MSTSDPKAQKGGRQAENHQRQGVQSVVSQAKAKLRSAGQESGDVRSEAMDSEETPAQTEVEPEIAALLVVIETLRREMQRLSRSVEALRQTTIAEQQTIVNALTESVRKTLKGAMREQQGAMKKHRDALETLMSKANADASRTVEALIETGHTERKALMSAVSRAQQEKTRHEQASNRYQMQRLIDMVSTAVLGACLVLLILWATGLLALP